MADWCMAHPWLTFWIVITALIILDSMFANLTRFGNNCLRVRAALKGIKAIDADSKEGDGK